MAEAFVHACQHGRTEVVPWFLDLGVRPNVAPYLGRTGLHWAIPYGHLEVIRLLLERGADPSSATRSSKPTPTAGCTCSTPLAGTIP